MSSSSTPNKFNFMTDSFKEEEAPKAVEDKKASSTKVTEKPSESASSKETTPERPKPQTVNPEQKSGKKAAANKNTREKKRGEKKTSAPVAPVKNSNSKELESIGKRSDPNYKTVGIMLPLKAHKRAKILLMDDPEERDFSDLMTELLEGWLAEQKL